MKQQQTDSSCLYHVVRNHEDQYSIWLADLDVPNGWCVVGDAAPKQACLDLIEKLWVDMRPRSLRVDEAA